MDRHHGTGRVPASRSAPATGLAGLESAQRFVSSPGPFAFFDAPSPPVFLLVLFVFPWLLRMPAVISGEPVDGALRDPRAAVSGTGGFGVHAANDDSSTGNNSQLYFTWWWTGPRYVSAGADGEGTGTDTLTVEEYGDAMCHRGRRCFPAYS